MSRAPISNIRPRLDTYLNTKQPPEFPTLIPAVITQGGSTLISALIVYLGSQGTIQVQGKIPLQSSTTMEIFRHLSTALDPEARYNLLNAMANQLRYVAAVY